MVELVFQQPLTPAGGTLGSTLLALVPVAILLTLLALFRLTAAPWCRTRHGIRRRVFCVGA